MHHADAKGDGVAGTTDMRLLAVDVNLTGIGRKQAVQDVHQRRLARSVLAD